MGKIDTVTKDYMKKNSVFADAFNYFIYGGKRVIKPENLQELETRRLPSHLATEMKWQSRNSGIC